MAHYRNGRFLSEFALRAQRVRVPGRVLVREPGEAALLLAACQAGWWAMVRFLGASRRANVTLIGDVYNLYFVCVNWPDPSGF